MKWKKYVGIIFSLFLLLLIFLGIRMLPTLIALASTGLFAISAFGCVNSYSSFYLSISQMVFHAV